MHSSMKSVASEMVNLGNSDQTVLNSQIAQLKWQLQNSCFNSYSSRGKEDSIGVVSEDNLLKDEGCGLKKRKVETEKPDYVCVGRVANEGSKKRKKHPVNPADISYNNNTNNNNNKKEDLGERLNSGESEPAQKTEYIHVRARRGQATDSHSLAERVRREKISERMKFLQDLVPGCNRITGKACVLDEIINYVQSLQRQIEFLSMKLAAADPQIHNSILQSQSFMGKEINSSCSTSISRSIPPYLVTNPQAVASHCDLSINLMNLTDNLACYKILPDAFGGPCFDGCGSSSWTSNDQELCNLDYPEGRECPLPIQLFQIENDLPII